MTRVGLSHDPLRFYLSFLMCLHFYLPPRGLRGGKRGGGGGVTGSSFVGAQTACRLGSRAGGGFPRFFSPPNSGFIFATPNSRATATPACGFSCSSDFRNLPSQLLMYLYLYFVQYMIPSCPTYFFSSSSLD